MDKNRTTDGVFARWDQEGVHSPEELDAYIRVIKPGTLIIVTALVLVLIALAVWGCTGTLPVTKNVNGVINSIEQRRENSYAYYGHDYFETADEYPDELVKRKDVYFFLNAFEFSGEELVGKELIVSRPGHEPVRGTVFYAEKEPYDREEIRAEFDAEWIVNTCVESDYSWVVAGEIDSDEYTDDWWSLVNVTIITDNVHPISFLLR